MAIKLGNNHSLRMATRPNVLRPRGRCVDSLPFADEMNMKRRLNVINAVLYTAASIAAVALLASGEALAADAAAAEGMARQNKCFMCHAVDKKKVATAWKDVAAKYKGDKDAEAKLYTHLTSGPKVKSEDGSEMTHPMVKSKNPDDIKNLVAWILSL
jgi:cytochrome c